MDLGIGEPAKISDFEFIFTRLVGIIIPLAGIVLFVMIVWGGFQYISSGGDPKKAAMAKATLTYAIIGLVLVALAYLIIFLISEFTGVDAILDFNVTR